MPTRKITINQLRNGMFIHELDIPWMQSPFLRHRRKISSTKDIALLKKAGVKELYIDLQRGIDIGEDKSEEKPEACNSRMIEAEQSESASISVSEVQTDSKAHSEQAVELKEEIKVAKVLQGKISQLVNQLSSMVKEGRAISASSINSVLDEAKASLSRNDQALLTMLHLYRQNIKMTDHGFGVFAVVLPLAIRLGCSEEQVNELGMAALLHDTGWSRLPMHLVGKNKAYTPAENRLIQQHPVIVENVLNKSSDIPENVKILVRQHHKYNDGSGYPDKLKQDEIFELVEILQVADLYDEYIHGITDQPGMLPANALKIIYQSARKGLFSETVVSELIHVMGIYPLTSAVRLSSQEKGLVIEIDKQKPLLPKVKIIYESDGKPCQDNRIIDLAHQDSGNVLKVTEVIDPIDKKEDPLGLLRVDNVEVVC